MCGLIGFNGQQSRQNNLLYTMIINDERGGHSAGCYFNGKFYKTTGESHHLLPLLPQSINTNMFIGHTRYGTHGENNIKNAHPYQYGNIIGAHNGVLSNYTEVGKKYGLKDTVVDSQMIFKVLNKTKDVKTLGEFDGTITVIYADDTQPNKLFAYRRNNPLYCGSIKNQGVYFSSLEEALKEIDCDEVWQLKSNRLYTFNNGKVESKKKIKTKFHETPTVNWNNYNWETNEYNKSFNNTSLNNSLEEDDNTVVSRWNDDNEDVWQEYYNNEEYIKALDKIIHSSEISKEKADSLWDIRQYLYNKNEELFQYV